MNHHHHDPVNRLLDLTARSGLAYAALMCWVGVFVLSTRMLADTSPASPWLFGVAGAAAALSLAWFLRGQANPALLALHGAASRGSNRTWLIVCMGAGLALRFAWVSAFPTSPVSDGLTYVQLAQKLIAGQDYAMAGTRAYWPPGFPFFLMPWLWLIENQRVAIFAANAALFLLGSLGVFRLGSRLAGTAGARVALLLFAFWPNLIFQSGTPEKEQVLVALMPWILTLWCGPAAGTGPAPGWRAAVAGIAFGFSMLVQPAVQLLMVVLFVCGWAATRDFRRTALALACLIGAAAVVVGPWTFRNHQVLGQFVMVSTNGGFGLFGANNPKASGGYLPNEHWPADLLALPELEADREGKRRAFQWIKDNPADFLLLAIEKNARFMGDDAVGAFTTLKREPGSRSPMVYAFFKGISNLYWLGFWWLTALALMRMGRMGLGLTPLQVLVPAAFLHSFALHSIAESAGKYHVLWTGVLCALLPMLMFMDSDNSSRAGAEKKPSAEPPLTQPLPGTKHP